jgi:ABC-2 type transport system permease protein
MFVEMFLFEIKYRLRHISTYVYFAIWFLMTFFSVSANGFGPIGVGHVLLNGPYAITQYYGQLTSFGIVVISAIFGTAILRDFQRDTYQLIFTKPISRFAYLGGRWAGSFAVSILVFSGLIFGTMCGAFMPWADKTRLAPINLWFHLQPFLSLTVVQIFFLGSLFFLESVDNFWCVN